MDCKVTRQLGDHLSGHRCQSCQADVSGPIGTPFRMSMPQVARRGHSVTLRFPFHGDIIYYGLESAQEKAHSLVHMEGHVEQGHIIVHISCQENSRRLTGRVLYLCLTRMHFRGLKS